MKILKIVVSIFAFSILISACSTNEELNQIETATELLESFTISKNVEGKYTVDYTTNNATSQIVKNVKENSNEIFLYASEIVQSKSFSEKLELNTDKLKVGFVDTSSDKKPTITVIDDNIVFAKGGKDKTMLNDYSLTSNEDGTFDLAFSVKNNVEVDFVYNEEVDTYEIHLMKREGTVSDFSRTFTPDSNGLKIDFVNHKNTASKGYAYKAEAERKPRIIIDKGE